MTTTKMRITIFTVILTLLTSCFAVSAAAEPIEPVCENTFVCYENTNEIQPRLSYFTAVFSGISIGSGKITCSGDYTTFKTVDVMLNITLERSKTSDFNSYSTVTDWSRTFSPGRGSNSYSGTYTKPVSGYYYRTCTTALAINSSGVAVEIVSAYSTSKKY